MRFQSEVFNFDIIPEYLSRGIRDANLELTLPTWDTSLVATREFQSLGKAARILHKDGHNTDPSDGSGGIIVGYM